MNITTDTTEPVTSQLHTTLGAGFFGFTLGAILFGITIRQAYQYYTTDINDARVRKSIVAVVCFLDLLHLVFSAYMMYSLVLQVLGDPDAGPEVVWSLKALGSTQTFLILIVQGFYLSQIWRLSKNMLLARRFSHVVQSFVIFIALFAIAVAAIFLYELQKITRIVGFTLNFEYIVYLGFGATALIDCAIAAAMCMILHKSSGGTRRSETVLETLIQYFIGTGLLTSFAAIMVIILYVASPNTLLYLGMEFSVTRLYANSILAMFNARQHLRDRMNQSIAITLPTNVLFGEPEPMQNASLLSNPFSPGVETKYSECECSMRGRKDYKHDSTTSSSTRGYTV